MAHNAGATRRSVSMTLNTDLVRRARALTPNLSETVEGLLAAYVAAEEMKCADTARQVAQWIAASEELVARCGSPADEHNPF